MKKYKRECGKANYRCRDNRKIGIKVDDSYQKSEEVSRSKRHIKEHMENNETFETV